MEPLGGQVEPRRGAAVVEEAFLALSPTVNARRAQPIVSVQAKELSIGHDDRFKALRTVGVDQRKRVEFRVPSSDANPYLAMAATLASGLLGMRRKLEPTTPHQGTANEDEVEVARTLEEGLRSLQDSPEVAEVFVESEAGGEGSEGQRTGQATAGHFLLAEARIHQARALLRGERMEEARL